MPGRLTTRLWNRPEASARACGLRRILFGLGSFGFFMAGRDRRYAAGIAWSVPTVDPVTARPVSYLTRVTRARHHHPSRPQAAHQKRAGGARRRRSPPSHGRDAGDDVRRARHRPRRHPGGIARRLAMVDVAKREDESRAARCSGQSRTSSARPTSARFTRRGACRSRNTTPMWSGRPRSGRAISTVTASQRKSRRAASSPPACSTRSITWMACSSSTICRS